MHASDGNGRGPALGEQAPFIEVLSSKKAEKPDSSRGGWIILVSHPHDLLPLLRTRTFNYILCKRKTRIVMLGNGRPGGGITDGNFLKKYMIRHNAAFLDDPDNTISAGYGLGKSHSYEEVKGVFVIDPRGFLRIKLYFDITQPRNFYEILKLLDALQEADSQRKRRPKSDVWKRRLSIVSKASTLPEEG